MIAIQQFAFITEKFHIIFVFQFVIGIQTEPGSHSKSSSQHVSLSATTIQFHHGINGLNHLDGMFHTIFALGQKHAAIHIHHVKVGLTNILKKLVAELSPKYQPAQGFQQLSSKYNGGNAQGIQYFHIFTQVSHDKIGIHSEVFNLSQINFHIKTGSLHTDNGAQFKGEAKHEELEQFNQFKISCISSNHSSISSKLDTLKSLNVSIIFWWLKRSSLSGSQSLSLSSVKDQVYQLDSELGLITISQFSFFSI